MTGSGRRGKLIDVSLPILEGSVFRLGTPPVKIASRHYFHESEGEYESTTLFVPVHTATHIDLVEKDRVVDPGRMIGRGRLIDVTGIPGEEVRMEDIPRQIESDRGDFLFFRTGWSRFVGTARYYQHPELSPEVVEWLASSKINMVGIDALGLGRDRKHGLFDRRLIQKDIFIIENLTNLAAIPAEEFRVYCFPVKLAGVDAAPARVVVETL